MQLESESSVCSWRAKSLYESLFSFCLLKSKHPVLRRYVILLTALYYADICKYTCTHIRRFAAPPVFQTQTRLNVMCCIYMYVNIWKKYVYLSIKVLKYYCIIIIEIIIIVVSEVSDALWKMFTSFGIFCLKNIEDCMKSVKYIYPRANDLFWGKTEW